MKKFRLCLAFGLFFFGTAASSALTLYNSFGPSDSFSNSFVTTGRYGTGGAYYTEYFLFTAIETGWVTGMRMPITTSGNASLEASIHLVNPPGGTLKSEIGSPIGKYRSLNNDGIGVVATLDRLYSAHVTAGEDYWLRVTGNTPAIEFGIRLHLNDQGIITRRIHQHRDNFTDFPNVSMAAVEMTGDAVPEPVSMVLLGAGALAAVARRRKQA